MFKNLKLRTKVVLASCLPLVLVVVLGVITTKSVNSLLNSSHWVEHTHSVIGSAEHILASAVDMETGARGFLLAGEEQFLAPYTSGLKTFNETLGSLKQTVSDNPAQVELLGEIDATVSEWRVNTVEPAITLRRAIGNAKTMDDMAVEIGKAKGKQYFDRFRNQIATFIGREQKLLDQRKAKAEASKSQNFTDTALTEQTTDWVEHTLNVISQANMILSTAVDMETGMRGYLLAGKDGFLDPYNKGIETFSSLIDSLATTVSDNPEQVTLLGEAKETIQQWRTNVTEPTIELRRQIGDASTMNGMAALIREARGKVYFDKFRGQIATFTSREKGLMDQRKAEAAARASSTKTITLLGTMLTIAIAAIISFFVSGTIVTPIRKIKENIMDIAQGEGDLTTRLEVTSKDEVGELAKWFNTFVDNMHAIIKQIATNSETLANSSTGLSSTSTQMSSNVAQTSSKAATVATSAQGMSATLI